VPRQQVDTSWSSTRPEPTEHGLLLTDKSDPLWLGNILTSDVPDAFAAYAKPLLDWRKKDEERKK
jgi:hypothetical protein